MPSEEVKPKRVAVLVDPHHLLRAQQLMPLADIESQAILASFPELMYPRYQTAKRYKNLSTPDDVTGFYQRKRGSK